MVDNITLLERLDQQFAWENSPIQSELRRLMSTLEPRFKNLEDQVINWELAVENITNLGVARVDEVLGPLLEQLQEAAQIGFLVAYSTDFENTMVVDEPFGITINSEGFQLFTPTPWVDIQDTDDPDNWGIAQLQSYDKTTGDLTVTVRIVNSPSTAGENWAVSASSGILPAVSNSVGAAVAAQVAAEAAMAVITDSIGDLQDLIDAVAEGPVASVAGKTGAVMLVEADIANLVTDLAAKATTTYVNTQVGSKQSASVKLDAISAMSWPVDSLFLIGGASSVAPMTLSALVKSLLQAADLAAAQTTLGISSFAATLLDNTDAASIRLDLGISAGSSPVSVPYSADHTTDSTELSKVIDVTTGSSVDIVITLMSPVTAGNGAMQTVRKTDTGTKKVRVVYSGTDLAWLSTQGDITSFRSNGTSWLQHLVNINPITQVFTASGTYTKPPLAKQINVDAIGAGGGGGAGYKSTTLTPLIGGQGGYGGFRLTRSFAASDVGSTVSVTVASAASGGTSGTGGTQAGTNGANGGNSSFGSLVLAPGGKGGKGTTEVPAEVEFTLADYFTGRPAIPTNTTSTPLDSWSSIFGGGAGGAGGSATSSAAGSGSDGGEMGTQDRGGGGANGSPGASGANFGDGGGGGNALSSSGSGTNAGAGGAGGVGGGGGGGGARGGSGGGSAAGAGGAGGRGEVTVKTFF